MRQLILFFLFLIQIFSNSAFAQFDSTFVPLQYQGQVPHEFLTDYISEANKNIKKHNKNESEIANKVFHGTSQQKRKIFFDGDVFFNGVYHDLVNNIKNILLENHKELNESTNIYVAKQASPNAGAYPDGTIFINLGLIVALENEAQLAFVIAHEIAHYYKSHTINAEIKMKEIKEEEYNSNNIKGSIYRRLIYSREDEFEADSKGLQFFLAAKYDAKESYQSLAIINDTVFKLENIDLQFIKTFSTEYFTIDSLNVKKSNKKKLSEEKSNVIFNSGEDLYTTHPNMDKRILALQEQININKELLEEGDLKEGSKNFIKEMNYDYIRVNAQFELAHQLYLKADYFSSLYLALYLHEKYPHNTFIKTLLAKNLHWIAYYSEIGNLNKMPVSHSFEENSAFKKITNYLLNIEHNDIKKMLFGYIKLNLEDTKDTDDFYFYYARTTETYLGKESGKLVYSKYLDKFPNGKNINYVKTKLND
jgi:beta-barrel assembly-enhancing protease